MGCIVLKGSEKAFAAGADITEMADKDFEHMYGVNPFGEWDKIGQTRTPMVASVSGFALGGGCELAMMCDMIIRFHDRKIWPARNHAGVSYPGLAGRSA